MNKITHLEGLRGLCCFIVVFDHCVNTFFPGLRHTGSSIIKDLIAWSPLNLAYSGIPGVYIFFILSGFVLSHKYNKEKDNSILVSASIKRYPRLIIPIFFSMLFMYAVFLISNTLFLSTNVLSLSDVFIQSFIYAPFGGGKLSNGVLWTIVFEIYGSFLVFATLAIFGKYRYKYAIYAILFAITFKTYYCLFIFGMALNAMYNDNIKFEIRNAPLALTVFALSLLLMAFPYIRPGVEVGGIYKHLIIFDSLTDSRVFLSKIGAMLLFWSMFNLKFMEKFFNTSLLQVMGKLSFSVYILHMSFVILMKNFIPMFEGNIERLLVLSLAVYVLTVATAFVFEKFIDRGSVKYTNLLAKKVS